MPRTIRASAGGYCYHLLNRGNARSQVFFQPADDEAFLRLLAEAGLRISMRLLAYCLMPNHFHLVVWPHHDGDLSRWMHWLMNAHVRRHAAVHHPTGHIWQGRFKAFAVQDDDHLRTVLRYVERNPLRANLVARAESWPWSSLARSTLMPPLEPGPAPRGENWIEAVNAPMTEAECQAIRHAAHQQTPLGTAAWAEATAARLGMPVHRPTPIRLTPASVADDVRGPFATLARRPTAAQLGTTKGDGDISEP